MNINGINNNMVSNTISNAKSSAADGDFERRLKSIMDSKNDKELKKVCQEFEGILLGMLYKQMKASVPKSELIPESMGTDVFESMLDDKLVEEASKNNSFGLGNTLYKQLSKQMKSSYKLASEGEVGVAEKK